MPSTPARLLCTGDLHVGRFPSYVPPDDRSLSVEATWSRTVDRAIQEAVDAVVLTGDVADEDNKVFEAFDPLLRGVERLYTAGIRTFAVAGNHDFDALHRLSDLVAARLGSEAFTLLGPRGSWTSAVIERDGKPLLRLMGWSFPDRYVDVSPLDTMPSVGPEVPTIGVLHADLDVAESRYAPVRSADLAAAPVAAWLLGHIHRPSFQDGVLYPGSLQPLDPGERGAHGPWLVTIEGASVDARQLPLATVRYDEVDVDLEGVEDAAAAERAVIAGVENHLEAVGAAQSDAIQHVLDVRFYGRTPLHAELSGLMDAVRQRSFTVGEVGGTVRRVTRSTRPAYDLAAIAQQKTPAGTVARLVLDVEAGEARDLVAEAARTIGDVHRAPAFSLLDREAQEAQDAQAARLLVDQGLLLLDDLLRQQDAHTAA